MNKKNKNNSTEAEPADGIDSITIQTPSQAHYLVHDLMVIQRRVSKAGCKKAAVRKRRCRPGVLP